MIYTIPEVPPSLNRFYGRQNSREYQAEKRRWKELVWACCWEAGIPRAPVCRALVELKYYFPDRRRRDPDNYSGKLILDGLVAARVIFDDSFACIDLRLRGGCDPVNPRVEIRVDEISHGGG